MKAPAVTQRNASRSSGGQSSMASRETAKAELQIRQNAAIWAGSGILTEGAATRRRAARMRGSFAERCRARARYLKIK